MSNVREKQGKVYQTINDKQLEETLYWKNKCPRVHFCFVEDRNISHHKSIIEKIPKRI